jgi:CRP/FNR family cyclic AMP-dependent transcriptional regulator
MFVDVAGRMAKALLELAARFGQRHGPEVRVPHGLTQAELGQLVGGSRETVNKTLSEFASRGSLRLENSAVVLLDLPRLAQRARAAG